MTNDGFHRYSYDAGNRIICVDPDPNTGQCTASSTSYTYDAAGHRITKITGSGRTNYWYSGGQVMAETDSAGSWTNYVFFAGQRLARNVPQPSPNPADIKFYITDHLHSTAVFADQSGAIVDDNDFTPWGVLVQGVGVNGSNNHYKFTGKERDQESGLDYFGARYYSSALGRFISSDWSAVPAPVPYADLRDPQSLNLYSYVRNRPTKVVDEDGHDSKPKTTTVKKQVSTIKEVKDGKNGTKLVHTQTITTTTTTTTVTNKNGSTTTTTTTTTSKTDTVYQFSEHGTVLGGATQTDGGKIHSLSTSAAFKSANSTFNGMQGVRSLSNFQSRFNIPNLDNGFFSSAANSVANHPWSYVASFAEMAAAVDAAPASDGGSILIANYTVGEINDGLVHDGVDVAATHSDVPAGKYENGFPADGYKFRW